MTRGKLHLSLILLSLAACEAASGQRNVIWALPNFSDRLEVRVGNTSSETMHALAVIDIARAQAIARGFPGTLAIVADQNGRTRYLSSQVDAGDDAGQGALSPVRMEAYRRQHQEFIDAVLEGREPSVTGEDGRAAVAVAEAAYESAGEGRVVQLLP